MFEVVYRSWNGKGLPESTVQRCIKTSLASQGVSPHASVAVSYIHGATMRRLNREYRGKDSVTDILSFPAGTIPGVDHHDKGDIFLCHTVIARKAKTEGKTYQRKSVELIVHGCLHILGFDHERDRDWKVMDREENTILTQLARYVKL